MATPNWDFVGFRVISTLDDAGSDHRPVVAQVPEPVGHLGPSGEGQQRLQLGALMALAGGDKHGQRPPAAITGQMELGRQPTAATAQCLVNLTTRS